MSPDDGQLSDAELGELAAFADGSLAPSDRARVAARVHRSPRLRALVDEQRASIAAVELLDARAPVPLHRRIAAGQALATTPEPPVAIEPGRAPARGRFHLPRPALVGGLAAAIGIAVVVAVVLVAGSGAPTVAETAELADRGASAPAPAVDAGDSNLLAASVGGVAFPNYSKAFGWRASGERTDELDGRRATTVYYRSRGREIAYSIVSGEALAWPGDARRAVREGIELRSLRLEGATVVTWRRMGRTCVLSGAGVSRDELLELAAWMAEGSVSF